MEYFGKRKSILCSRDSLRRIITWAGPTMVDGKCLECGAPYLDCSPRIVEHTPDCKGDERYRIIAGLIYEAALQSWWRRFLFWT